MRPSHMSETLVALMRTGQSAYLQSAPGLGKSSLVFQAASKIWDGDTSQSTVGGVPDVAWFRIIRGVDRDPVDLRGIPYVDQGQTKWARPDLLDGLRPEGGCLCLDELPQSTPAVQCALRELLLDRRLGGHRIPDSWTVIATGNRQQDRAGANRLLSHVASAVVLLDLEVSVEDWQRWALNAGIAAHVRSFINFKPSGLHDFDPSRERNSDPRAWERLSRVVDAVPDHSRLAVCSGCVGEGWAAEYLSFRKLYLELPDPAAVLKDPASYAIPQEPSVVCALLGALAERLRGATRATIEAYSTYVTRMPDEYCALGLRDGIGIQNGMLAVPVVTKWAMAHPHLFGEPTL